jgi:hypothetical protein
MNILSDTLNDFAVELTDKINYYQMTDVKYKTARVKELIEEYVERIKNELNVEKYLQ